MKKLVLAIDIGGTKIHIGHIHDGKILKEKIFPTNSKAAAVEILHKIRTQIESFQVDFDVIAIGVPGLVDEKKGIIYDLNNIPSWKEVHLKDFLESHFKVPVLVTNDANMFVLGEKCFGKARNYRNFVGISIGTGLGTGIFIDNKLYAGNYSAAGELGSLPYKDKTIEDYCSGKFFLQQYQLKGSEVYEMALKGDEKALRIFDEYGSHLGEAIKMVLFLLSPQAIFLGGSVSKSYKFFEKALKDSLASFPFSRVLKDLVIETSDISKVAMYGAAALVEARLDKASKFSNQTPDIQ
ncbi:ROK family protein [Gramella sp. GC03-9]|uniref:ROK family protein n=1 Tax=Christiangramia oceanisediminis TaxID=2920386 RepID=A0A9X2I4L4_9FLAO|nr:ROK family protein [Gramella oceanisediminis]MCP9199277.1 ROK family protein [Gramella oceanisediminis]